MTSDECVSFALRSRFVQINSTQHGIFSESVSDFQNSSVDFTTAGLKIVTPTNKSRFFADQSSNKNQQLTVEVIGGADSTGALTAVLDKKSIYKVDRPFIFTIPVTAGAHTLDVTLGNESDSISFTVE